MKLTTERLKQIIKEELKKATELDRRDSKHRPASAKKINGASK